MLCDAIMDDPSSDGTKSQVTLTPTPTPTLTLNLTLTRIPTHPTLTQPYPHPYPSPSPLTPTPNQVLAEMLVMQRGSKIMLNLDSKNLG
jgi:hypothetical protein